MVRRKKSAGQVAFGSRAASAQTRQDGVASLTDTRSLTLGYSSSLKVVLNRVQSSRRLERAGRNLELLWLLGRLVPDHKTIADFRKDNGLGLRQVCARFVELCRELGLLATASVAIDGSKFKAVNNREQLEESVARYLSQLRQPTGRSRRRRSRPRQSI